MSKYLAEQISEVVVNTHFEDLPQYAVDKAKMLTLDVLASMVGTRKVISSEIARDVAAELGGPEEASIVGYGKKVAAPNAAFANAIQCYGLDFVDDHNESNAHPSPVTYPVSFALAEQLKRSGKEFIEACVLGNEIVCRMGSAYLGDMYTQGFHPTSTCGTMGGVVSAAKLMKLDEQKVSYAQGIAGSAVAGLMAWNTQGSFTKRYQAGRPSMDVIVAARMAEKGFNGPTDIFESQDGLLHAYSYQDRYDTNWITKDLGKEWIFATSSIKVYPCCRYSVTSTPALRSSTSIIPIPPRSQRSTFAPPSRPCTCWPSRASGIRKTSLTCSSPCLTRQLSRSSTASSLRTS